MTVPRAVLRALALRPRGCAKLPHERLRAVLTVSPSAAPRRFLVPSRVLFSAPSPIQPTPNDDDVSVSDFNELLNTPSLGVARVNEIYEEMERMGIEPDMITMQLLFRHRARRTTELLSMCAKYKIPFNIVMGAYAVEGAASGAEVGEILELLTTTGQFHDDDFVLYDGGLWSRCLIRFMESQKANKLQIQQSTGPLMWPQRVMYAVTRACIAERLFQRWSDITTAMNSISSSVPMSCAQYARLLQLITDVYGNECFVDKLPHCLAAHAEVHQVPIWLSPVWNSAWLMSIPPFEPQDFILEVHRLLNIGVAMHLPERDADGNEVAGGTVAAQKAVSRAYAEGAMVPRVPVQALDQSPDGEGDDATDPVIRAVQVGDGSNLQTRSVSVALETAVALMQRAPERDDVALLAERLASILDKRTTDLGCNTAPAKDQLAYTPEVDMSLVASLERAQHPPPGVRDPEQAVRIAQDLPEGPAADVRPFTFQKRRGHM
eukprot:TRINITY_DN11770_c0_g1_i1.p1 TRINITY_DN11770_c0_g1~~TRINITY_DN11770_c0_g1_i1.p1  ORF type:complete len:491 (+),score=86.95 TRINITY_DN11770_c0_g1_i1:74-1546(+)